MINLRTMSKYKTPDPSEAYCEENGLYEGRNRRPIKRHYPNSLGIY